MPRRDGFDPEALIHLGWYLTHNFSLFLIDRPGPAIGPGRSTFYKTMNPVRIGFALFLLLPLFAQCARSGAPVTNGPGGGTAAPILKAGDPQDVAEICAEPERYLNRNVVLSGTIQGYMVAGCSFPEAARTTGLTRGDWLFRTGAECMYVTAGMPPEADMIDPAWSGRGLEIEAKVMADEAGGLYLHYLGSKILPAE